MENWLCRRRLPWEEVQVERGDAGRRVAVIFVGDDMLDVNRGEVDGSQEWRVVAPPSTEQIRHGQV